MMQEEAENPANIPILLAQSKLSKQQILKYNLSHLLNAQLKQMEEDVNLRESSNKLQSLAQLYLKQHQYLKQDIEGLQNTLYDVEEQKSGQMTEKAGEKKKRVVKELLVNNDAESDDSFVYQENARNITTDQQIQINNFDSNIEINFLHKKHSIKEDIKHSQDFKVKNIMEIQKRPLKEIIQERQNQIQQQKLNATLVPEIILQPPFEELENQFQEEKSMLFEIDQSSNGESKIGALESFFQQISDKSNLDVPKQKREKKIKLISTDKKVEQNYETNVEQLKEHQSKITSLDQKIQEMNLYPEIRHSQDDKLLKLIYQIELESGVKQPQNQESKKNTKFQIKEQSKQMDSPQQFDRFQEFENFSIQSHPEVDQQEPEIEEVSYTVLQKAEKRYGKNKSININQFFALNEDSEKTNKSKAFYDLMILSRIGKVKIEQTLKENEFPELLLKI